MQRFTVGIMTLIALFSTVTLNAQSRATLAARIGTVEVMRNGAWTVVGLGEAINAGERLRTGEGSSAAVDLGPGRIITLSEGSQIEVIASNGSAAVRLEIGNIKVVSEGDIQVSTKETTLTTGDKPLHMELGYKGDDINVKVITGAVRNGPMVIWGAEESTKRIYSSGGRGRRSGSTVVFPNVYFYPYVVYGNRTVIRNATEKPSYPGYWPSQIIPPMTNPLRPPVHYPLNPFPTPQPRNQ